MVNLQVVTQRVAIRHFEVIGSGGQGWLESVSQNIFPLKCQALRREQMEFMLKFLLALLNSGTHHLLLYALRAPRTRTSPQRFATSCRTLSQVWALIPRRPSW